jgi:outer membrane receptor protein involved in Fe transport
MGAVATSLHRAADAIPLLVFAVCLVHVQRANAQDEPATSAADSEVIDEIVVTGSRIVRRDFSSPSPIATIDSETLLNSGQSTLEASLNQMPQVTPDYDRTSNNPGDGTARLNLRGLGSQRTLVLLNGRRLAPSGVGTSVDLNNLSQVLVERVEVITGGATTVYGSDAVSGVVNFITRDDFDGLGVDASAYTTEQGDSEAYDLNLTYGHNFASGRGNITLFGGYYEREASFASDREFTEVPWIDTWEGELVEGGSFSIPAGRISQAIDLGNGPAQVTFTPDGIPIEFDPSEDVYNYAPANYLQIPMERYSTGLFLNYEFSDRAESYAELAFTRNDVALNLAPVPAQGRFFTNWDNPVLTPETQQLFADNFQPEASPPWPPNTVAYNFSRRLEELGPRTIQIISDYSRIVAGLRGDIGDNWEFDTWFTYTKGEEEELLRNDGSRSRLQQGLLVDPVTGQCYDPSNGCVPLDLYGVGRLSAQGLEFIRVAELTNTTSREQTLVSGFVRGSPFASWAGDVDTAFGVEWRKDKGEFTADDSLFSGDTLGFVGDSAVIGSESVYEIYAEALVPLMQGARFAESLDLELGARYSDYEHAGEVTTYKVGGSWQPSETIRFRSMFQHSVRAPNLYEAFQQQYTQEGSFVFPDSPDPCSASSNPDQNGNREKCIATGVPADQIGIFEATLFYPTDYVYGGNPDLTPEDADSLTIGFVLTPDAMPNVQLSVDYFELELQGAIGDLDATLVCFDPLNTQNLFCSNFTRDPVTYNVSRIYGPKVNRGILRTEGVDTQISFRAGLPDMLALAGDTADISINLLWTHLLEQKVQKFAGGTTWDCAGRFGWPCFDLDYGGTFPVDRVTTNINYDSGKLSVNLNWRWMDGTDSAVPFGSPLFGVDDPDLAVPTVAAKNYLDLGIGYQLTDRVSAHLTVANVFETDPPMMADAAWSNNTDTRMYDIFGRSYTLNLSMQFFN